MTNGDFDDFGDDDFGFTFEDSSNIEEVVKAQEAAADYESAYAKEKEKVDKLYEAILPLIKNLKKNPEQDLIRWPNRLDAIKKFEKKLKSIIED